MAKITLEIDGVGNPTIDVQGAKGKICELLTKPFDEAYKGGKASITIKPEMHQTGSGAQEIKASA